MAIRIFVLPRQVRQELSSGAPGLDAALRESPSMDDPELHIEWVAAAGGSSTWNVVLAADGYKESFELDVTNYEAMRAAVSLYVVALLKRLEDEHPLVLACTDVRGMVLALLEAAERVSA